MSRRTRKNVGIIGLGIIGSRVRDVLRRKGFHVFVWNRTPRPVPNFVGAPDELAEMCDCLQIFVSDDEALDYVVKQLSPGLSPRHVVIAHSTVSPHSMTAAAEAVERRGARFVEAPFTGSKEAAEKGELVYYVGGDEAAIKEVRPILEASGKQILEIGEVGQATARLPLQPLAQLIRHHGAERRSVPRTRSRCLLGRHHGEVSADYFWPVSTGRAVASAGSNTVAAGAVGG